MGSATLSSPIVEVAEQMRQVLDWSAETRRRLRSWEMALTRLRENAEASGVLVMISGITGANTRRKLDPEEFRGFALADPYAALVFVNGADSKAAQIFTLAHELAHLWLGETALSDVAPESVRVYSEERWCNQVGAELLVPMREFRIAFDAGKDIRSQLQPLAERFRVSTQFILGRIRDAGVLSWDRFMEELRIEKARVAKIVLERGGGGNHYNTKPVQVGKRFARELIASTLEGRTPYTEAFRLLNVKKTSTFEGLGEQLGVLWWRIYLTQMCSSGPRTITTASTSALGSGGGWTKPTLPALFTASRRSTTNLPAATIILRSGPRLTVHSSSHSRQMRSRRSRPRIGGLTTQPTTSQQRSLNSRRQLTRSSSCTPHPADTSLSPMNASVTAVEESRSPTPPSPTA